MTQRVTYSLSTVMKNISKNLFSNLRFFLRPQAREHIKGTDSRRNFSKTFFKSVFIGVLIKTYIRYFHRNQWSTLFQHKSCSVFWRPQKLSLQFTSFQQALQTPPSLNAQGCAFEFEVIQKQKTIYLRIQISSEITTAFLADSM